MDATHGNAAAAQMLAKAAMEEAAAALNVRRVSAMDDLRVADDNIDGSMMARAGAESPGSQRADSPDVTLSKPYQPGGSPLTPDVRLWHRAVVVHQENSLRGLVRQLSIDQLDNEGRRVSIYEKTTEKSPLFRRSLSAPVSGSGVLRAWWSSRYAYTDPVRGVPIVVWGSTALVRSNPAQWQALHLTCCTRNVLRV